VNRHRRIERLRGMLADDAYAEHKLVSAGFSDLFGITRQGSRERAVGREGGELIFSAVLGDVDLLYDPVGDLRYADKEQAKEDLLPQP
jgi:hypothetical protein